MSKESTLQNILSLIKENFPPIHEKGHSMIFIFGAVSVLLWAIWDFLGFLGLIATCWCVYFFRDPERVIVEDDDLVLSPADGVVQKIEQVSAPAELNMGNDKLYRVSIFLNIFNVHVQRTPVAGEVTKIHYHPGKFLSANLDKASDDNERNSIVVKHKSGKEIVCVQIAGLVARRIICFAEEKQNLTAGERYGIIKFGSRVDIYLPKNIVPQVIVGQTAIGGETIIASFKESKTKIGLKKGNKV